MNTNYRWLNEISSQFLERDYLLPGQTVDDRVTEICQAAERILKSTPRTSDVHSDIIENFASRFKENFEKGWYSFASPVWSNFGTDRGLPISCFGTYIEDSMESILEAHSEVGMMTKIGGGTSGYFGNLRPRGSKIKNNGESYGAVHFMQLFDTLTNVVSQGSTRRGSFAAYLDIEHEDIEEFLTLKSEGSSIQDTSFGVCIGDDWMNSMINGDDDKRRVWAKVLQSRANVGFPYIFFRDTANRNAVDAYKDNNMMINHTNLCLTGDTDIIIKSNDGIPYMIKMDIFVTLWNMGGFSNGVYVKTEKGFKKLTKAAKTGAFNRLIKITSECGKTIRCTEDHKIFTKNRGWVEAKNLLETDELDIDKNFRA